MEDVQLYLPRWNVRKLDKQEFANKIQQIKQMTDLQNIDGEDMANKVTKIITECCNASMPKVKKYKKRNEPAYWWTPEIKDLRTKCLSARRKSTRNHCEETLPEYRRLRKKLRTAIKKVK